MTSLQSLRHQQRETEQTNIYVTWKAQRSEAGVGAGGSKAKQEGDADESAGLQGDEPHRPTVRHVDGRLPTTARSPHAQDGKLVKSEAAVSRG